MAMKGKDKHLNRLKKLSGPAVTAAAGRVLYVGADMIRAEAHRGVSAGSVSGKGHVASLPGEYPNREFGDLQAGFKTNQTGPLSAEFRSEAPHSRRLEFGTRKMKARPHVRPSRDKKEPEIRKLFAKEIGKLVKGSG
jgi:HK97 gp10 family phage protein